MRITGTWADFPGATVDAAAAAEALSVTVDTTIDLDLADDETGWLVLAGGTTPFEYVAADDDETTGVGTVTLAAGLPVALEAGDSLRLWDDEAGIETVNYKAQIADDDGGSFEAAFAEAPTVPLESLVGASVDVDDDDVIVRIWGREPVVEAEAVDFPSFLAHRIVDTAALASGTWHRMTWGTVDKIHGFSHLDVDGWLYAEKPGRYDNVSVQNWQNNTSGARRARLAKRALDGTSSIVSPEFRTAPDATAGDASPTLVHTLWLEPGEAVSVEVWQSTGSGLSVTGDAGGLRTTWAVNYRGSR